MMSQWRHSRAYNEINEKIDQVKAFIESDISMVEHLTMRERTFLKWNLYAVEDLIYHGADTEEESSSCLTSSSGNGSSSTIIHNPKENDGLQEIFPFET